MCLRETGGPVPGGNVTEAGLSLSFFLFVSLFLALGHSVKASPSFSEKTGSMKSWCSNEEIMFEETAFNLSFWYYLRILRFPLSRYLILLSSLSSFPSDCLSFLKSI